MILINIIIFELVLEEIQNQGGSLINVYITEHLNNYFIF